MATENKNEQDEQGYSEIGEMGNRVRYIQRRVEEISSQLDDHYHVLHEIWEATTKENGGGWYDLYDHGTEYE